MRWILFFFFIPFGKITYSQTDTSLIQQPDEIICSLPSLTLPEFPGGQDSLNRFIKKNLRWPSPEFCGEGTEVVSFIVNENGSISNIEIIRSLSKECDDEAQRLVELMPRFSTSKIHNKHLKARFLLPIRFQLE